MEGLGFGVSVTSSAGLVPVQPNIPSMELADPSYTQLIDAGTVHKADAASVQPSTNFTHSYLTIEQSGLGLSQNSAFNVTNPAQGGLIPGQTHVPINITPPSGMEQIPASDSGQRQTDPNSHTICVGPQPDTCVITQTGSQTEHTANSRGAQYSVESVATRGIYQTGVHMSSYTNNGISSADCVKINAPTDSASGEAGYNEPRLEQLVHGTETQTWSFPEPSAITNNNQMFFTTGLPTYAEIDINLVSKTSTDTESIIQCGHKSADVLEIGSIDSNTKKVKTTDLDSVPKPTKDIPVIAIESEHICRQSVYKCGGCKKQFVTICILHNHLKLHTAGGSYHYDHVLQTAFPKYDTCCTSIQTSSEEDIKPPTPPPAEVGVGKRKRGRKPRKVLKSIPMQEEPVIKSEDEDTIDMIDAPIEYVSDPVKEEPREEEPIKVAEPINTCLRTVSIVHDLEEYEPPPIKDDPKADPDYREERKPLKIKLSTKLTKEISGIIKRRGRPMGRKSDRPKLITCSVCDKKFTFVKGLRKHEIVFHSEMLVHGCDACPQKFMQEDQLTRHQHSYHSLKKSEEGTISVMEGGVELDENGQPKRKRRKPRLPTKFLGSRKQVRKIPGRVPQTLKTCEICGFVMKENRLQVHLRTHTGERPCVCDVCGKGLISEKKLKRHLMIHSEVKKYKCTECPASFLTKYKLKRHTVMHTGEKPYLCAICGAEFSQSQNLAIHTRSVHFGEKRFTCLTCDKRFATSFALKDHTLSHSEERTLTCRYCGKQLKHSKSLRRHEQTHVSDVKFECDMCSSAFARKDNLDRHKTTHYDATYQCRFCSKKLKDRCSLVEHEVKSHSSETDAAMPAILNVPYDPTGQSPQKTLINRDQLQLNQKQPSPDEMMEADQKTLMEREMAREMLHCHPAQQVFRPDHSLMLQAQNLPKLFHCVICNEAFNQSTSCYMHMEQKHRVQAKMIHDDQILPPNLINPAATMATGMAPILVAGATGEHDQQVFNQINMTVAMAADASNYYKMQNI